MYLIKKGQKGQIIIKAEYKKKNIKFVYIFRHMYIQNELVFFSPFCPSGIIPQKG